jgi:spore maturation protein CgeB
MIELDYPDSYVSLDAEIRGDYQERNKPRLSYRDYLTKIGQSKIAITVRGHGRDTVRYWEIPGYETLMFICDPGLEIPNDFVDGETAVFFKQDFSDLKEKIDYYLANDEERIKIAKAGHQHLLKYHTNKARAEYFINILNERKVVAHV